MVTEITDNMDGAQSLFIRNTDFYLHQSMKDNFGRLVDTDGKAHSVLSDRHLLDSFAPYVQHADGRCLYNALMCYLVSNLSASGICTYSEHVDWQNRNLYFASFCSAVSGESAEEIYELFCYSDVRETAVPIDMRAKLDIMRVSVLLMRNLSSGFYKDYTPVFKELCSAMQNFCELVTDGGFSNAEKIDLLDCAITVCRETFLHPCAIDENGIYRFFRDDFVNHRISYTGQTQTDRNCAVSLYMGYSPITLKLYCTFAELLCQWLLLYRKTPMDFDDAVLENLYAAKHKLYKSHLEEISAAFSRIKNGYGAFYDFYSQKNIAAKMLKNICEIDAKKLSDNLKLVSRGFDNGMKSRAEGYAVQIVAAVKTSKNPVRLVRTALDKDFPLSEHTYKKLYDLKLYDVLVKHKYISDLDKALLCAHLVFTVYECRHKSALVSLIERICESILERVAITSASLSRICSSASLGFVLSVCEDRCGVAAQSLSRILSKLMPSVKKSHPLPEEILARAFLSFLQDGSADVPKKLLCDSAVRFILEIVSCETDVDREGLLQICADVLDPEDCEIVRCELEKTVFSYGRWPERTF